MSILVRGMEMPTTCAKCPCGNDSSRFCRAANEYIPMLGRPEWCPLVEVEEFEVWPNNDKSRKFNILKTKGGMHFMGPNGPVDAPKGDNNG